MAPSADSLPTDLASAHAMIIATREALLAAEARASAAESEAKHRALLIEKLKIYDRQAAPRQVRPIFGAGRHPGATRAGARGDGRRCRSGGNGGADGSCSGQD